MNGTLLNYFLRFAISTRLDGSIKLPRPLRTLYFAMFGVEAKLPSLETLVSLDDTALQSFGITEQLCPLLQVTVHKSLVYGSMRYTTELLALTKRVCGYDDLMKFYDTIYTRLNRYVMRRDMVSYSRALLDISHSIRESEQENFFKILATLGDLSMYSKTRSLKRGSDISISMAIENDLFYVSTHFNFDDEVRRCNKRSLFGIFKKRLCVVPVPILLSS